MGWLESLLTRRRFSLWAQYLASRLPVFPLIQIDIRYDRKYILKYLQIYTQICIKKSSNTFPLFQTLLGQQFANSSPSLHTLIYVYMVLKCYSITLEDASCSAGGIFGPSRPGQNCDSWTWTDVWAGLCRWIQFLKQKQWQIHIQMYEQVSVDGYNIRIYDRYRYHSQR